MQFAKGVEIFFRKVIHFTTQLILKKQVRPPSPHYKKILFIRFDVLGDMIISLPVLRAVRMNNPETEIDIICK